MSIRFTALALPLALAATGAAHAQETRASALAKLDAEFKATDTNKDGVLTLDEVQARMARMATGSGRLDATHAKRLAQLWFQSTDRNHDGKVTLAESRALMTEVFDRYDLNHDGRITADERAAAKAGSPPQR